MPKVLLLDNRDSFVWNLAQALGGLGAEVVVLRTDRATLDEVAAAAADFCIVSPGPGRPEDAGISMPTIRALAGRMPILGVCLGHQAIGACYGARIERVRPCHGKTSAVLHTGKGLFAGLPNPLQACRYHSLQVTSLPPELIVDARTQDGVVMAIHHVAHPTFGVQFHPESFRSEFGPRLLANFLEAA